MVQNTLSDCEIQKGIELWKNCRAVLSKGRGLGKRSVASRVMFALGHTFVIIPTC